MDGEMNEELWQGHVFWKNDLLWRLISMEEFFHFPPKKNLLCHIEMENSQKHFFCLILLLKFYELHI